MNKKRIQEKGILAKLLEKIGIKFETVKSGVYKDILSPDRSLTTDERALLNLWLTAVMNNLF